MTGPVEHLVRETLTDPRRHLEPDPQLYSDVLHQARVLRRRSAARWAGAAAGLVAVTLVVVATTVGGPQRSPGPAAQSPTRDGTEGTTESVTGVTGLVADVARTKDALFLVESSPNLVVRVDAAGRRVTGSAPGLADPAGIAVDAATGRLWLWSSKGPAPFSTSLREYDAAALMPLRDLTVPAQEVFAGVMLDGALWLTTSEGLYRVPQGAPNAQPVPGTDRTGYGLAADATRHRVLVAGDSTLAVDTDTLRVTAGELLGMLKPSVAVVAGRIWVGGYGGSGPRVVRLDPGTLRPVGTSTVTEDVGPGATLWSGAAVVWVRNGGDLGVECIDPADGRVLERFREVQGPVTSTAGAALGANPLAIWLRLNKDCAG